VKTLAIPQFFGFPRLNLTLTRTNPVIKSLCVLGVNLAHAYIQVLSLSQWGTAPKDRIAKWKDMQQFVKTAEPM